MGSSLISPKQSVMTPFSHAITGILKKGSSRLCRKPMFSERCIAQSVSKKLGKTTLVDTDLRQKEEGFLQSRSSLISDKKSVMTPFFTQDYRRFEKGVITDFSTFGWSSDILPACQEHFERMNRGWFTTFSTAAMDE